jgi:hypothetical protein
MFLYKALPHLPEPPKEIINSVDLYRKPEKMEIGIHNKRFLTNWYGRDFKAGVNVRTKHPAFEAWVRENITNNIVDAGVNYITIDDNTERPVSSGAHVDVIRKFTLLYLLEPGGPSVETVFWKEKGVDDIVRAPGTQIEDFNNLKRIAGTVFPSNTWCILYTQVLHSIENIYKPRVAFQISLNEVPDDWGIDVATQHFDVDYEALYKQQAELEGY